MAMSLLDVVNLLEARVDLRRAGDSAFLAPDFSSATTLEQGVIAWDPCVTGVLGGLVEQSIASDHGGERHLDGDELILVIAGQLCVVLLEEDGKTSKTILVRENEATLIPCGVWHRLKVETPCRYLFFGGGKTEIRRA